jgi:hypothetical protein
METIQQWNVILSFFYPAKDQSLVEAGDTVLFVRHLSTFGRANMSTGDLYVYVFVWGKADSMKTNVSIIVVIK